MAKTVVNTLGIVDTDTSKIVGATPQGVSDPTYWPSSTSESSASLTPVGLNQSGQLVSESGSLVSGSITTGALTTPAYTTTATEKILSNNTATNCTITIAAGTVPDGALIQQLSTGTCTVVAGAGVTFIGSTLATASAGEQIAVIKTNVANTFIVKVS